MVKRTTLIGLLLCSTLALVLGGGCGPSTELTGTPIPNSVPDTRVTGVPPELTEAGFVIEFHWSAFDPDGRVEKYQWKISDNGTNGISVQDTLTFDPVTGDTLNPWFETIATDSVFFVTADIPDFPGDEGIPDFGRSFQTHTFWVRAIDDRGGVDPTPAHVSFTSTTLVPTTRVTGPTTVVRQGDTGTRARVPPTVSFLFTGNDPDFVTGLPTKYRYLWKRALRSNGQYLTNVTDYNSEIEELASFADSAWTDWLPFPREEEDRRITFRDQLVLDENNEEIHYLFAIQVQDTAGAVSVGRAYGRQVGNVRIVTDQTPVLTVIETFLGPAVNRRDYDIAGGQPLNFRWSADASGYSGNVESYRYGWNVADPDDPNDPGWALPAGDSPQHRRAPQISFSSGTQRLTIHATDDSGQTARFTVFLNVVPVPDPASQLPLLYVDDLLDQPPNDAGWEGADGTPLNADVFRDGFWRNAMSGSGGVQGWNPDLHSLDIEDDDINYRVVVDYRNLVWISRYTSQQGAIASLFRPQGQIGQNDRDRYIWLIPYQAEIGNLLLAGSAALTNFLASAPYELPIVFQSREYTPPSGSSAGDAGYTQVNGVDVRRAFGERIELGENVQIGPTRYPYAIMGIAVLDLMSPAQQYYEYNTGQAVRNRRRSACVATRGLVLDPEFKNRYMPAGGAFPDTIWTDPLIDWNDRLHIGDPYLLDEGASGIWPRWGGEEFVVVAPERRCGLCRADVPHHRSL